MPFSPAARGLLCSVGVALALVPLIADEPEFCVAGTVLNAITGEPLRRAAVTIPQSAALTDAAGAFRFCNLPAGAYFANAEKPASRRPAPARWSGRRAKTWSFSFIPWE